MKISIAKYGYHCDTCTYFIKSGEAFVDFDGFTDFTGGMCFGCIQEICEEIQLFNEGT